LEEKGQEEVEEKKSREARERGSNGGELKSQRKAFSSLHVVGALHITIGK